MQLVIFTDLDGTLLDDSYSFKRALPALRLIQKKKIPLVLCTSKTEPEVGVYLKKMRLRQPFIAENGAVVFIPKNYFNFKFHYNKIKKGYFMIELGAPYKKLKKVFSKIKKQFKHEIAGFHEMSVGLIAKDTGLSLYEAKLAKKRRYSIPFKISKNNAKEIVKLIKKYKMNYTKSKNYHYLMGRNDKAKAVKELVKLYKRKFKKIKTIALGDNLNDLSMLKEADEGYWIQKKDKSYENNKFRHAEGIGPEGWNRAVLKIINEN